MRPRQEGDDEILQKFGVEVVGLKLASRGYILDFRYRVVDPEKAKPLLGRVVKAYIVDDKSQARLQTFSSPKTGPLRSSTVAPVAGRVYMVEFANPAIRVKPAIR
jgi:hypothetical protein